MSLMSESSCASTVKEFGPIDHNHIHQFQNQMIDPNNRQAHPSSGKRFSPANSVTPSVAYQSGWNPAPSTAQHMWAGQNGQNGQNMNLQNIMPNGQMRGMSDDSQSIISMSSSISQNHLRVAQQRMEKRQRKKLSKSAQSVGLKSQKGEGSGSSGSSNSKSGKKPVVDGQSVKCGVVWNFGSVTITWRHL